MQSNSKTDLSPSFRTGFWGILCESGLRYSQVVDYKFHITMAALDPRVIPTSPCVSLMLEHMGSHYLLCNLKPDSMLQVNLDLYFEKGETVAFSVKGVGIVHLSGYYIYDSKDKGSPKSFQKSSIKNLTMDVVHPKKSAKIGVLIKEESSGGEELSEQPKRVKKEPTSPSSNFCCKICDVRLTNEVQFNIHLNGKRHQKNLKKEKTSPVLPSSTEKTLDAPTTSPQKKNAESKKVTANEMKIISKESSDEDDSDYDPDKDPFAQKTEKNAQKRTHSYLEDKDSGDESDEDSSDDVTSDKYGTWDPRLKQKRLKTDISTPIQGKPLTSKNRGSMEKSSMKSISDDMDSSIGRTPMPKKKASPIFQQTNSFSGTPKATMLKESESEESSSDSDSDEIEEPDSSLGKTPTSNKAVPSKIQSGSAEKGTQKEQMKAVLNDSRASVNTPNKAIEGISKAKFSKKLPGDVEYEDIRIGSGPIAKKGKLVHVFYTGKLENNKVFDARQPGSKPFSFKLGLGQVIKGWELGIEGMKVGGKRILKIPPQMGYGKQRMGNEIPPNSTLYFTVELKAVS